VIMGVILTGFIAPDKGALDTVVIGTYRPASHLETSQNTDRAGATGTQLRLQACAPFRRAVLALRSAGMTTTMVDEAKSSRRKSASGGKTVAPRPPGQRRNRAAVLLGLVLVIGFGLGGTVLYASAGQRDAVLVMERDVAAGARIGDADLRVAHVNSDSSMTPVPASARSQVVGRIARVGLVPGALLTPAHLAPKGEGVPPGQTIVALLLEFGQAPALSAGDRVLVVAPAQNLSVAAQVLSVDRRSQSSDDIRVSLVADEANATRIATIAATKGELSLVLRPSGQ
jgi:hypothetical protein